MRINSMQAKQSEVANPADCLLTVREAAALLTVSVPTFWRRVADGTVPRPLKIGSLSRWSLADIEAVIERAKSRRAPAAVTAECRA